MESLIKQTRARYSDTRPDNRDEGSSSRERRIPLQKTQSFRERKRSQSWIRRQFSRQMSSDYDIEGVDYPTAVAAAAYAIQSVEESRTRDRKEKTYGTDKSMIKTESKAKDDAGIPPEPLKSAPKSSDGTSRHSFKDPDIKVPSSPAPSLTKKISFADADETITNKPEKPAARKAPERAPTVRRPSSFSDKQSNITDTKKPDRPPPGLSTVQPVDTKWQSATKPGPWDSQADAWEKEKMARIKERYEKLMVTIDNWEIKKKKKANRKIAAIMGEVDKKRAKAEKNFRSEITTIEEIAGGARAQAEQNRKKEELKVKEKANKIRSTGKLPANCLCF